MTCCDQCHSKLIQQCRVPEYLGVSRQTFWRHIRPYLRKVTGTGRAVLYRRVDLDQWIEDSVDGCERPKHEDRGDSSWELARKQGVYTSAETRGISINKLEEKEFADQLERAIGKKPSRS